MKKYLINDKIRYAKMFERESFTEDTLNKLLKLLKPTLDITVSVEELNTGGYMFLIVDNVTGEKKKKSDFNCYEKGLLNSCFNDYLGLEIDIEKEGIIIIN